MSSAIETKLSQLDVDKSDWMPVKFGDITFEPKETAKDALKEGIEHVVGLEHIQTGDIHLRNSNGIEQSTTFTKKFSPNDLLFGRRRAYLKKAAQAQFTGICSGDIIVMRAKDDLMSELLPFIVNNDKFIDWAIQHSAGGLSPRCKFKDLANYEFLLPPKAQQAEIAELLWALDEVVEKELDLLETLKRSLKALIEESVPKNFDEFLNLGELISIRRGLTYASSDYSDKENGIPLLNLKSVEKGGGFNKEGIKYYKGAYNESHFAKNSDLLVACTDLTRLGNVVGYPLHPSIYQDQEILFTLDLVAIEIKNNRLLRDYLYYALKSQWIHWKLFANSPGTTVLHLNLEGMLRLKIPKLSIESQEIAIRKLKEIDKNILSVEKKLGISKSLQKSIINKVF